jgi:arsenite methyltransferase
MFDLFRKKKSQTNWPPPNESGGRQHECAIPHGTKPSSLDEQEIKEAIRQKYAEVAISSEGKFAYPTGRAGAEALGYDPLFIREAPASLLNAFCGVGNPFSLGQIKRGDSVLDVGSGAGFDLYVAGRLAGETGRVCGTDLTREMVDLARQGLAASGVNNIELVHVSSEEIPYSDHTFDTVISNGVINLSPCKQELFQEIFRVLKNGGKLQFADVALEKELPDRLVGSAEAWSQWIGGTIPVRDQIDLLEKVGFSNVESPGSTGFRTSQYTVGVFFRATKITWALRKRVLEPR